MASMWFNEGRRAIARGEIDWVNDDIRAVMVDEDDHTFNAATDAFLDDIPAGARVATSATIASRAVVNDGEVTADPTVIADVAGDPTESVLLYKHTGVEATSTLLCKLDATFTPNGSGVQLNWSTPMLQV